MLTLFTIPRLFRGEFEIIQRNAIKSWTLLPNCPEIILFGDDEGTALVALEFGVLHIPDIARNEYGTPLVNDVFEKAQRLATHDTICYVNADIILLSDFMIALEQVVDRYRRFLMVGQRWDVDIKEHLYFGPNWEEQIRTMVAQNGQLHRKTGIDYFAFSRGLFGRIPAFAIGRTLWDNWLLYRARTMGAPLIDGTKVVTAVHQNHGWSHVKSGKQSAKSGPEAMRNRELLGDYRRVLNFHGANRILTTQGLRRPKPTIDRLLAYVAFLPVLHPRLRFAVECLRYLWRAASALYRRATKFFGIKQRQ